MKESDERYLAVFEVKKAYAEAEKILSKAGKLLRANKISGYGWAKDHNKMISGLAETVRLISRDLPEYAVCPECSFKGCDLIDDNLSGDGLKFKCPNVNCNHVFHLR